MKCLTQKNQPEIDLSDLFSGDSWEKGETKHKKEKRIEREFGAILSSQGIPVRYQVSCEYGIADIVTPDTIYEIKASLSRSDLHKAVAQVLLYQRCLNPQARMVVVGCPCNGNSRVAVELAHELGVEVILWKLQ